MAEAEEKRWGERRGRKEGMIEWVRYRKRANVGQVGVSQPVQVFVCRASCLVLFFLSCGWQSGIMVQTHESAVSVVHKTIINVSYHLVVLMDTVLGKQSLPALTNRKGYTTLTSPLPHALLVFCLLLWWWCVQYACWGHISVSCWASWLSRFATW